MGKTLSLVTARRRQVRVAILASCLLVAIVGALPSPSQASTDVTPDRFQEVSSGVALIKTYGCGGRALGQGTGFLVGESVVMTARHVLQGACKVTVRVNGEAFAGQRWVYWSGGRASQAAADLGTLKLDRPASGAYVFRFRASGPPSGTNLGMVGYPLGNRLSLNQGKIIGRGIKRGAPLLAVRMLGAEGASGAPFIDDAGRVVGILQVGYGSKDVLGQRTAGVLVGLDLVRWWGPRARLDLCRSYPKGGIAGCPTASPTPDPTPAPDPAPTPAPPSVPADYLVGYGVDKYVSMSGWYPNGHTIAVFVWSTVCPYDVRISIIAPNATTTNTYRMSGVGQGSIPLPPGYPTQGGSISIYASPEFMCDFQNPGQAKIELRVITR